VEELVNEFTTHGRDAGYLACMIAILYFLTIYGLEKLGSSTVWKPSIRGLLADYAYPVSWSPALSRGWRILFPLPLLPVVAANLSV
jgi:hypothetical protein